MPCIMRLQLVQPSECDKRWLPIEYLSHMLSVAERSYDTIIHDFVAMGLRRRRPYIFT